MKQRAIEIINSVQDHRHGERAMLAVTRVNDTHEEALAIPPEADSGFAIPATDLIAAIDAARGPNENLLVHIWPSSQQAASLPRQIAGGRIEIDDSRYTVSVDANPVALTTREFELLSYLSKNVDLAISRETIFRSVWGQEPYSGQLTNINPHVTMIRRKIGKELGDPTAGAIQTVRNIGYKAVSHIAEADHA